MAITDGSSAFRMTAQPREDSSTSSSLQLPPLVLPLLIIRMQYQLYVICFSSVVFLFERFLRYLPDGICPEVHCCFSVTTPMVPYALLTQWPHTHTHTLTRTLAPSSTHAYYTTLAVPSARQHNRLVRIAKRPAALAPLLTEKDFEKTRAYSLDKSNFEFYSAWSSFLFNLALLFYYWLPWIWKWAGVATQWTVSTLAGSGDVQVLPLSQYEVMCTPAVM